MKNQKIPRELLYGYAIDSLSTTETATVERALRESEETRSRYQQVLLEIDQGDHSLGVVWQREHLTCPDRDQLGAYILEALDPGLQEYITFHLKVVGCPYCQANLTDLKNLQVEQELDSAQRRKRYFQSSAGLLQDGSSKQDTQ